ncbi:hypothetical protein PMAYCL1PPCAC_08794, partial [Pristionchus mayeri]
LQQSIQKATGKSYEIIMGKGKMRFASHQMTEDTHCRQRIGEFHTTVYETPVQYNINDIALEKVLSNIDFGENLGGSGYPGQMPFPQSTALAIVNLVNQPLYYYNPPVLNPPVYYPPAPSLGAGECFSGDLIVETREGPRRMDELRTGDEVLSIEETMISFSPIIMFLHRDEEWLAEFNLIHQASGDWVKLTNEHLIYVTDCHPKSPLRLVKAREVTTRNCLMSVRSGASWVSTESPTSPRLTNLASSLL